MNDGKPLDDPMSHSVPPSPPMTDPSRRDFLGVGALAALSGMMACARRPDEPVVPLRADSEDQYPGVALRYATAAAISGRVIPLLAQAHDGRPTKLEVNREHPMYFGGTLPYHQAMLLDLYDPSRLRSPLKDNAEISWNQADAWLETHFSGLRATGGKGLCLLSELIPSPTFRRVRDQFHKVYPQARWFTYEPVSEDNERVALTAAFGEPVIAGFRFSTSRVIVSLDHDFLGTEGDVARNALIWADQRDLYRCGGRPSRLHVVEGHLTLTGSNADHRYAVRPSDIEPLTWALTGELMRRGLKLRFGISELVGERLATAPALPAALMGIVATLADDLSGRRGRCLLMAGRRQPPAVHGLVAAINHGMENQGRTVRYYPDARRRSDELGDLEAISALTDHLRKDQVDTLVICGGNPVYNAPGDLDFASAMDRARTRICLSYALDETSRRAQWVIPRAHFLEAWGDYVASNGYGVVQQPLTAPLHGARSDNEFAAAITGVPNRHGVRQVYAYWKGRDEVAANTERKRVEAMALDMHAAAAPPPGDAPAFMGGPGSMAAEPTRFSWAPFEETWRRCLHDGWVQLRVSRFLEPGRAPKGLAPVLANSDFPRPTERGPFEIVFYPAPGVHDGRFANNPWAQETPDPTTQLTWGNAALVGPDTASTLGVTHEEHVQITVEGRRVTAPVCVVPGTAEGVVAIAIGYGRHFESYLPHQKSGVVGVDVNPLRTVAHPDWAPKATVTQAPGRSALARLQPRRGAARPEDGRPAEAGRIHEMTVAEVKAAAGHNWRPRPPDPLKIRLPEDRTFQWGMVVDLGACIGCNACVVACAIDNNIPPVGHEQVRRGADLGWIRVDRYQTGPADAPRTVFQPVMCQHCQNAPCERACSAKATTHSPEGLNEQIYDQCKGLKDCIAACPFDTRRFNTKTYNQPAPELVQMGRNPNVTLRYEGLVEKCTYCVQRLNIGKREARLGRNDVESWESVRAIQPACVQACPARALIFGNIQDDKSEIVKMRNDRRHYALPSPIDLRARTTYLARMRNPISRTDAKGG